MQFDEALRYLLSLGNETLTIKLGLRNTELLLEALGSPQCSYPAVQIAGTNGKGSTAVFLDSICQAAGIKTGLFTSPHLVSITERIRTEGREISPERFATHATRIRTAAEELLAQQRMSVLPTFFEHVTALALLAFQESGIELAILETGLGGRLDATTAVRAPVVAITPIALDHEEYLGTTIESVAAEKAAIIRRGVTAIVAPQPSEALQVILKQCESCEVEPIVALETEAEIESASSDGRLRVTFTTARDRYEGVRLGLRGRHQVTNALVAIHLAEALGNLGFEVARPEVIAGLESAQHPGRLELLAGSPPILLDGAHNPGGAQALREYLDEFVRGPITLVFGAMRDKNLAAMTETLFSVASRVILTEPLHPRAAPVELLEQLTKQGPQADKITSARKVSDAIQLAREITPPGGLICIAGSLYLLGEVKAVMQEKMVIEVGRSTGL